MIRMMKQLQKSKFSNLLQLRTQKLLLAYQANWQSVKKEGGGRREERAFSVLVANNDSMHGVSRI